MLKQQVLIAMFALSVIGCASNGDEHNNDSEARSLDASERMQPTRQCRRPAASAGVSGSSPTGSAQAGGTAVSPVSDCDVEDAAYAANAQAAEKDRKASETREQANQEAEMQSQAHREEMERLPDSVGSLPNMPSTGNFRRF